ncbi:hypothetical protein KDX32_19045 [Burkholderia ambifaria]|uniref:hypothetical protein n=1 Tax=Burkholderia ambifaria TaxID=152480 RepID=UPI001B9FE8AB|nr:hypothetical protein [Burkholderia ambifaria]MBR8065182.1 hypothetical protein [Burkholderia ambifaria]
MAAGFSFDQWRDRLHVCADFASEEKCDEFLGLLKAAEENMSHEVVVELLRTFSDADDFGIQERTRNVVEATDRHIFYPALIRELGGIIDRAPQKQWAVTLVGIELECGDFGFLMRNVLKSSDEERVGFISFLKYSEFMGGYPTVSKYLIGL